MSAAGGTKHVLFCGGEADGRWFDLPANERYWRVPVVTPLTPMLRGGPVAPSILSDDYVVEQFTIFGRIVWVASLADEYGHDRHDVIIRALFQRDVADELRKAKP